jgi:hypothetical protein
MIVCAVYFLLSKQRFIECINIPSGQWCQLFGKENMDVKYSGTLLFTDLPAGFFFLL